LRSVLVFAVAACVGGAGVLPHLFFAFDTGEHTFFQAASDESFYALVLDGRIANWNDYPIRVLDKLLISATGGANFYSALLSDVIWPALAALAAGYLALKLVRGWALIVPLTLALLFGSDILGINSSLIYPATATISSYLRTMPLDYRKLFSDPVTSFLYIYRTPEPQLSLAFFFCYFAIVIRTLAKVDLQKYDWLVLGGAGLICTLIYPFFAAATLMVGGVAGLSLILAHRWFDALTCFGIVAVCALGFGILMVLSHAGEADATRFASSLPIFAPSIVYGLALLGGAFLFRRKLRGDAPLWFALGCCLIPLVTLDQQLITGTMVQTINWERNVNYPTLVVAAAILFACVDWIELAPERIQAALIRYGRLFDSNASLAGATSAVMLGIALLFLFRCQLGNYRQWAFYNLMTAAYAEAVDRFYAENPGAPRRVTLDRSDYDAPIRVRLKTDEIWFGAYADLVTSLKTSEPGGRSAETADARTRLHRDWGFEHAARLGLSKSQLAAMLNDEIDKQACWPNMMFYFPFLECAPYVSDFRMFQPARLKMAVPAIADAYQESLTTRAEHRSGLGDALLVTATPHREGKVNSLWTQKQVGTTRKETRANGFAPRLEAVVYSYWQTALQ